MLAEIPYSTVKQASPESGTEARHQTDTAVALSTDKPFVCPVDTRCHRPLALGGAEASLLAENAWYATHAHCLMCNVHKGSPCAAPYFAYNAHRDVFDTILQSSPRRAALEHSAAGRLRPPLGCQGTVRTWIDMFLSTAVSSCHTDNLAEMFSDARLGNAEKHRDGYMQQVKHPSSPPGGSEAVHRATTSSGSTDAHFGCVLRRAHRDLLVDMAVLEAVRQLAEAAALAAADSKDGADVLHIVAEDLAPFAKTQALTTCASLVDLAVALRDMLRTRRGLAAGEDRPLQYAYLQELHAMLGLEEQGVQEEEAMAAERPRAVMHGMPKPSCGVWLEADGSLHAPKPCFKCPASEQVLLADIAESLHELLEPGSPDAR